MLLLQDLHLSKDLSELRPVLATSGHTFGVGVVHAAQVFSQLLAQKLQTASLGLRRCRGSSFLLGKPLQSNAIELMCGCDSSLEPQGIHLCA